MMKRMVIAGLAITSLMVAGCSEDVTNPNQPVDTVLPLAPIMIGAIATDGIITAQWETNTEPDLAGYRVYMQTPTGAVSVTNSLIQHNYVVFDSNLDGGSVTIYATAIDYSGNESNGSQDLSVDLHAALNASRRPAELEQGK